MTTVEDPTTGYSPAGDYFPSIPSVTQRIAELSASNEPLKVKEYARRVAKDLAEVHDLADLLDWRDFLKAFAKLPGSEFDLIVKKVRDGVERRESELAEAARAERHRHELDAAQQAGHLIPGPSKPLAAARKLMNLLDQTDDAYHLAFWRGDHYRWTGTRWVKEDPETLRRWIYLATETATYDAGPVKGILDWDPSPSRVDAVMDSIATVIIQRHHGRDDDKVIACRNGVYDITSSSLLPHSPRRFNLHSLPYNYDGAAVCPTWTAWLADILDHDLAGLQLLKEWFGYVISGRTDLQKMLSLVGPRRCGKGTIGRVLLALLGQAAVTSPNLATLGDTFGRESLIGKSLALLADVRWTAATAADAIPIILTITGEDSDTVPRKNRTAWEGTLGVRFMALSNDVPNFSDPSGAAAGRMMHIEFTKSFYGREDTTLTDRLLLELPGILNWSLDGLRDLKRNGRFTEPGTSAEVNEAVMRLSSAEYAFTSDMCEFDTVASETLDDLFSRFRAWCHTEGKDKIPTKEQFSRGMRSALGDKVRWDRPKVVGNKVTTCHGIRILRMDGLS